MKETEAASPGEGAMDHPARKAPSIPIGNGFEACRPRYAQ